MTLHLYRTNLRHDLARHETRDGVDFLVVPAVILVEGVLNGALLTAEEFGEFVDTWNDVPVPLYHPQSDGQYVSARDLNTQDAWVIGRFYNASLDGQKLRGEFWIDTGKAERLGAEAQEAIRMLEAGEPVEVSTGYFCDEEPAEGEFGGVAYHAIQRNLRPDHVALLPHSIGACSWQDGCGAPRVNTAQKDNEVAMTGKTLVALEISLDERLRRIYQAWDQHMAEVRSPDDGWYFVLEAYDDRIVVAGDKGRYWQYPYTETDGGVVFGDPVEVERTYAPISAQQKQTGDVDVNREQLIQHLAANCKCGRTEDQLRSMTDDELHALEAQMTAQQQDGDEQGADTKQAKPETNDEEPEAKGELLDAATLETLRSLAEAVNAVGADNFRNVIAGMVKNERAERSGVVVEIVANSAGQLQAGDLEGLSTEVLRKMRSALTPQTNVGRGTGRMAMNAAGDPKTIAMPSLWQ